MKFCKLHARDYAATDLLHIESNTKGNFDFVFFVVSVVVVIIPFRILILASHP